MASKTNGIDNPTFVSGSDELQSGKNSNGVANNEKGQTSELEEEDSENRAQWGNGLEFLMSCIAMSVGLGNIWRFPFTAKENGGGAFLIPYIIVLTVIGRPLYYMEMALGQFSNRGNVKMYEKLSPVLKGIGFGQLVGTICVATYYCCLMAITLFYLAHSFTSNLPWTECQDEKWASYLKEINMTCVASSNTTGGGDNTVSSSELWFRIEVLRQIDDISSGIGVPDWRLTLCLLASWIVTFLVSIRGVKSSGKASYFLAIFPYVIMITLLIRASTLEGAGDGMYYFIETDWNKLKDASVWYAAVTQCFFSLNVAFGSIIMYSSYNPFHHNINRDALIVTTLDTFTSLLSGATIFGILGNLAYELDRHPSEVVSSGGTGLAFISYPEAIAKFNFVPWLFAILFFFMLFVLGIGSLVALQNCVNTVIKDSFPYLSSWIISGVSATAMFLIGLMYVTPGGQYMLDLVDHFGGTFIIFIFAILEVYAVVFLYGLENFCLDLEYMTHQKVGIYWRLCWGLITPVLLLVIFIYFLATLPTLTYGIYQKTYPDAVMAFGWCILGIGILQALMWIAYYAWWNTEYPIFSTETWGPSGTKRTDDWKRFKQAEIERRGSRMGNGFVRQFKFIFLGR